MDAGKGQFEFAKTLEALEDLKEEFPEHGGIFKVGEEIEIRGSLFRIKSIKPKELRLRLLRRKKQ